jgi:hypothetical protein
VFRPTGTIDPTTRAAMA